jgi:pimeloyl-ACP methyl ester carboxylesterase
MSEHWVTRGRVRLAYERRGGGPLVVLVHGLGMPGRAWLGLIGGLVKSGNTVVAPDNRGSGRSDAPPPPYHMRQLAADTAAVIEHVDRGPALVVGISLGGMIAQHLALNHPRLVRGLVLGATTCGLPRGRPPPLRALLTMARGFFGDPRSQQALWRLMFHPQTLSRRPQLAGEMQRQLGDIDFCWAGILGQFAAHATHSTCLRLGRLRCPTEVLVGEGDRIIPPRNARILASRIPGAELTVLPEAGHVFPLEQPRAIPRAIRRVQQRASNPQR